MPGVDAAALFGRGGGLVDVELGPKKSKPRSESPPALLGCFAACVVVCWGGGGCRAPGVATEAGRGAGGSSSKRLICCAGARGAGMVPGAAMGAEEVRVEDERSSLAFS